MVARGGSESSQRHTHTLTQLPRAPSTGASSAPRASAGSPNAGRDALSRLGAVSGRLWGASERAQKNTTYAARCTKDTNSAPVHEGHIESAHNLVSASPHTHTSKPKCKTRWEVSDCRQRGRCVARTNLSVRVPPGDWHTAYVPVLTTMPTPEAATGAVALVALPAAGNRAEMASGYGTVSLNGAALSCSRCLLHMPWALDGSFSSHSRTTVCATGSNFDSPCVYVQPATTQRYSRRTSLQRWAHG